MFVSVKWLSRIVFAKGVPGRMCMMPATYGLMAITVRINIGHITGQVQHGVHQPWYRIVFRSFLINVMSSMYKRCQVCAWSKCCTKWVKSVKNSKFVILHCGTNNFLSSSNDDILSLIERNIAAVRVHNPTCVIAISAIIQRPYDDTALSKQLQELNCLINKLCRAKQCEFLRTYRAVLGSEKNDTPLMGCTSIGRAL